MINLTLYKRGFSGSFKLLIILMAVLTMYYSVIISMFDPKIGIALVEIEKALPELMALVGMTVRDTTLISFMVSYLYGFIILVFPMLFSIITANKLVAQQVDKGSMSYLLAAPHKRSTVIFTQLCVLVSGIIIIVAYATCLSLVLCEIMYPGDLDVSAFIWVNFGALCLHLFIGGICFLSSCIFNDTKFSLGFGAGIPLVCLLIQMLANTASEDAIYKYFSFFTLYNPDGIANLQSGVMFGVYVLLVGAICLYIISILIFSKKDLHI